jgi:diguanylate cyclase (GGDEF)-like protein
MTLDASTLAIAGALASFVSGLTLLFYWWQERAAWAALWWAVANCALGVGVAGLALNGTLPDGLSHVAAPLVLDTSAALAWVAARIFNRGSIAVFPTLFAIGVWFALIIASGASGSERAAATLGAAVSGGLYAGGAVEFWLGRGETVQGRWPMISLLSLEALSIFLVAIGFAFSTAPGLATVGWFGIIHFVGLIYAVGSAIFLIMMLNERTEMKHKADALIDSLTGLANRRNFMAAAQRMFARNAHDDAPISLLAFDLDRFKKVNDTFGHPMGDRILQIFSDALSNALRPSDIAGRIGGDEFAAALTGCDLEGALAIARRIRSAFEGNAQFVDGQKVGASVSIGVAVHAHSISLEDLIASADKALYQAKHFGGNRVVSTREAADPGGVVRIA